MGWFCPTFQRPERLAELALSWEKTVAGKILYVRVWDKDPRKDDYFSYEWPEGWILYESDKEWAGEALNEHFDQHPDDGFYGFIGDDIVLRTKHGLDVLEHTAGNMFMAYPNDTVHRHRMYTHFCLGGGTARSFGFVIPRVFYHFNMDRALGFIMANCGLQRYCPQVIFQHKHFLWGRSERDDTYKKVYGDIPLKELDKFIPPDEKEYLEWEAREGRMLALELRKRLVSRYERTEEWNKEDIRQFMGVEESAILCN